MGEQAISFPGSSRLSIWRQVFSSRRPAAILMSINLRRPAAILKAEKTLGTRLDIDLPKRPRVAPYQITMAGIAKKTDLGLLEEDDEFEEFTAEGISLFGFVWRNYRIQGHF